MKTIHILDPAIANKIAAGEVVERPASVIKELIENSIDAGSTRIFIDVEDAGKALIRVADNGQGIPAEQVPLAFLRHATSKIETIEDIYAISSLGFRGEALASIASVSKVELLTKTPEDQIGLKYSIEGGKELSRMPVATNTGTTIAIRELFYNTPARYKFLKSNTSENIAILDILQKIAIAHPEVALHYKNDGKTLLQTKGDGKRDHILYDLWGSETHAHLLHYEATLPHYKITAYFSRPSYTRGNRNHQWLIVNGRSVRSKAITDGIFEGYRSLLMVNRFPAWVVVIDMDPSRFDINIHPAKMDIKFQDENMMRGEMNGHVRAGLLNTNQIPTMELSSKQEPEPVPSKIQSGSTANDSLNAAVKAAFTDAVTPVAKVAEAVMPFEDQQPPRTVQRTPFKMLDAMVAFAQAEEKQKAVEQQISIPVVEPQVSLTQHLVFLALKPIGAFMNAYILAEYEESLYMIDQHAAHERILYEAFMKAAETSTIEKQVLMIPITKDVDTKTMLCFEAYAHYFEQLGLTCEKFGERTLILRESPTLLNYGESQSLMEELLDLIGSKEEAKQSFSLEDFAKKACKAAVKAHDALTMIEIKQLLADLSKCENPYTCPHGRPVTVELTRSDIEKRFKRI